MNRYRNSIIGVLLLIFIFIISCFYSIVGPDDFGKEMVVYNESGKLISKAPSPPSMTHILGTNRNGQDILFILVDGAKYTLILAVIVTILRVMVGMVIGIIIELWFPRIRLYFNDFFIAYRYIPTIIITLLLMRPFSGYTGEDPDWSIIIGQLFILVLIQLPAVLIFSSEIIDEMKNKSYVKYSKLMGASKIHIFKKHIYPYLKSYILIVASQQFLNILMTLMHLGIFGVFIGGSTQSGIFGKEPPDPASITNEWSGLIGQNFPVIIPYPWIVISPILGFFVLVYISNAIKNEVVSNAHLIQNKSKSNSMMLNTNGTKRSITLVLHK